MDVLERVQLVVFCVVVCGGVWRFIHSKVKEVCPKGMASVDYALVILLSVLAILVLGIVSFVSYILGYWIWFGNIGG